MTLYIAIHHNHSIDVKTQRMSQMCRQPFWTLCPPPPRHKSAFQNFYVLRSTHHYSHVDRATLAQTLLSLSHFSPSMYLILTPRGKDKKYNISCRCCPLTLKQLIGPRTQKVIEVKKRQPTDYAALARTGPLVDFGLALFATLLVEDAHEVLLPTYHLLTLVGNKMTASCRVSNNQDSPTAFLLFLIYFPTHHAD